MGHMKEPSSWFREEVLRAPTDVEAISMSVGKFSKGKYKAYRCTILNEECSYQINTGAGDCRRCNFALAYLMTDPQRAADLIKGTK